MPTNSPASKRIDQTLSKLSPEIRELAFRILAIIHKAEPMIEETWKWGPAFEKNGLVLGLWGFKNYASMVFYHGVDMSDKHKLFNYGFDNARNRTIKFASIKDINEKKLIDYIKEAVKINAPGKLNSGKSKEKSKPEIKIPAELAEWFVKNKKAKTFFDGLAFSYKKEMVLQLTGAKQEETRKRRFTKVTKALAAGKTL